MTSDRRGSSPGVEPAPHLREWELPPGWRWGSESLDADRRHVQEIVDALGRSLALVSVPDPANAAWLAAEARLLAHRSHPSVPTTYHYWSDNALSARGPGYLRRWVAGEHVATRIARVGPDDVPTVLQVLRGVGSALSYLHDSGSTFGALGPDAVWLTPTGRLWLLGWQWAVPADALPLGIEPDRTLLPCPPEWDSCAWTPTRASDQWQLGAVVFAGLTGELPPTHNTPPVHLLRPECPAGLAMAVDLALAANPGERHVSVAAFLRAVERAVPARAQGTAFRPSGGHLASSMSEPPTESEEARLRWATGDDYEVLASLGSGTFGSVWRVRDLALEREVALKMLHPHVAADANAVNRFRREARLAAQLAHPGIVPVHDWDSRGEVTWYTMELADGGSVADLIARRGPRALADVVAQIDLVLDGLAAAHARGVVHRDLKPENILVDRYRRWRVADFGIARMAGEELAGNTGTPAFAAPEQLLGEEQGPETDCFAMAAIVAYVLGGSPPFGEGDGGRVLARELAGQITLPAVAPEIEAWLRRALAAEPAERYADAAAMQEAWRAAVHSALRDESRSDWWRRWLPDDAEPEAAALR